MPARRMVKAAISACVFLTLFVTACGGDSGGVQSPGSRLDDPGPVHVHGLGINPKDGALFIATHTGLYRAATAEQESKRVADRYQDTMGFTVVGPDRFLGSGHPDLREVQAGVPPLLGLVQSTDGGQTWDQISLQGKADFHVLETSGRRVYGFDSSGDRLLLSTDGGRSWSRRPQPEPLQALAANPQNGRHIVASGVVGLHVTADEGRSWDRLRGGAGLLAWPKARRLYLVRPDGRVLNSSDAGKQWREVGQVGGQPAAFEAAGEADLYVALHDGTVKRSTDGGASWEVRSQP